MFATQELVAYAEIYKVQKLPKRVGKESCDIWAVIVAYWGTLGRL